MRIRARNSATARVGIRVRGSAFCRSPPKIRFFMASGIFSLNFRLGAIMFRLGSLDGCLGMAKVRVTVTVTVTVRVSASVRARGKG